MELSTVNMLTLDFIYSGLSRIPDYGEEVGAKQLKLALGGGPISSAIIAERYGGEIKIATCWSEDTLGSLAKTLLERETKNIRSFSYSPDITAVNVTSAMTFGEDDRSFVTYFADIDFDSRGMEEIYEYVKDTDYCLASRPCGNLFGRLKEYGCRVVYDVGWSDDLSLAGMADVLKDVYLFTPNEKEALKLTGAATPREALDILADYVEMPIVKLGKDGALVHYEGKVMQVLPFVFEAVDTTGAGDAFLGGLMFGLMQEWDLLKCVALGNYSGGKATTALGCLTARGSVDEFEQMYESLEVKYKVVK